MGCRGQDRGQAAVPVAVRALRRRQAQPEDFRLRRRWLLLPGARLQEAAGRDEELHRPRLHGGQEEDRRRLARRRPAPHRRDHGSAAGRAEAMRRRQRPLRPGDGHRLCQGDVPVRPVLVRGAGRPAGLRASSHAAPVLQEPDGHRRGLVLDAGRAQPDPLRRHAPGPRLAAVRLRTQLRPGRVPAHAGDAEGTWLVAQPLHPARRPPDVAEHRGRSGPGRQRVVPRPVPTFRRVPRRREGRQQLRHAARAAGRRLRGQGRSLARDEGAGRLIA